MSEGRDLYCSDAVRLFCSRFQRWNLFMISLIMLYLKIIFRFLKCNIVKIIIVFLQLFKILPVRQKRFIISGSKRTFIMLSYESFSYIKYFKNMFTFQVAQFLLSITRIRLKNSNNSYKQIDLTGPVFYIAVISFETAGKRKRHLDLRTSIYYWARLLALSGL